MNKYPDAYTPKERGQNFSPRETDRFQRLVNKYKDVIYNKKTDSVTNNLKNTIWAAIHAEFNASADDGDPPRTLLHLRHKFHNMRRNFNKNPRTMVKTIDDNQEHNDQYKEVFNFVNIPISSVTKQQNISDSSCSDISKETFGAKTLHIEKDLTHNNKKRKNQKLKTNVLKKIKDHEEHLYQIKLTHMEQKRIEEKEIYELKKKKLLLQIALLEKKSD